jgi:hypothetical protein
MARQMDEAMASLHVPGVLRQQAEGTHRRSLRAAGPNPVGLGRRFLFFLALQAYTHPAAKRRVSCKAVQRNGQKLNYLGAKGLCFASSKHSVHP